MVDTIAVGQLIWMVSTEMMELMVQPVQSEQLVLLELTRVDFLFPEVREVQELTAVAVVAGLAAAAAVEMDQGVLIQMDPELAAVAAAAADKVDLVGTAASVVDLHTEFLYIMAEPTEILLIAKL